MLLLFTESNSGLCLFAISSDLYFGVSGVISEFFLYVVPFSELHIQGDVMYTVQRLAVNAVPFVLDF